MAGGALDAARRCRRSRRRRAPPPSACPTSSGTAPTRSASTRRSRASTSTSANTTRNGSGTSSRSSAASRRVRSRSAVAQKNSTYWNATQERSADLAAYLIAGQRRPCAFRDAPGGASSTCGGSGRKPDYDALLTRGKTVFAENCARCHSSKLPEPVPGARRRPAVQRPELPGLLEPVLGVDGDRRTSRRRCARSSRPRTSSRTTTCPPTREFPSTRLETEICSSMASNAIEGYVWDNFSSQSYKTLPAVGDVHLHDPVTGETSHLGARPAGGAGTSACRRSSRSGRPHRSCTTTRSASRDLDRRSRGRRQRPVEPSTAGARCARSTTRFQQASVAGAGAEVLVTALLARSSPTGAGDKYRRYHAGSTCTRSALPAGSPAIRRRLPPSRARSARHSRRRLARRATARCRSGRYRRARRSNLLANINVDRNDPRFSMSQSAAAARATRRSRLQADQRSEARPTSRQQRC